MRERFPWDAFMRAGMGVLKLSPKDFWAATPREIASAFPRKDHAPPPRAAMDQLMQMFPDEM